MDEKIFPSVKSAGTCDIIAFFLYLTIKDIIWGEIEKALNPAILFLS